MSDGEADSSGDDFLDAVTSPNRGPEMEARLCCEASRRQHDKLAGTSTSPGDLADHAASEAAMELWLARHSIAPPAAQPQPTQGAAGSSSDPQPTPPAQLVPSAKVDWPKGPNGETRPTIERRKSKS